jgi:hypothetical protein
MWARVFPVSWTTLLIAWPAGGPNFGSEAVWRASWDCLCTDFSEQEFMPRLRVGLPRMPEDLIQTRSSGMFTIDWIVHCGFDQVGEPRKTLKC